MDVALFQTWDSCQLQNKAQQLAARCTLIKHFPKSVTCKPQHMLTSTSQKNIKEKHCDDILYKCCRKQCPCRVETKKMFLALSFQRHIDLTPSVSPFLPSSSSYTTTDTRPDPKEMEASSVSETLFLSLRNWKMPEISPTSSLPPGSPILWWQFVLLRLSSRLWERKCAPRW